MAKTSNTIIVILFSVYINLKNNFKNLQFMICENTLLPPSNKPNLPFLRPKLIRPCGVNRAFTELKKNRLNID